MNLITCDYQGFTITYQDDGWFNATQAAAKWGKEPYEWLRLPETKAYLAALERKSEPGKSRFVKASKGGNVSKQGTWLHPKLAVPFSRWLDVDFAVWCDAQIDNLIRGKDDWRKLRHASASGYKLASDILKMVREDAGKETKSHHYSNEARLINWALTGEFQAVDRDSLGADELDKLAYLQERNAVLIGRGLSYEQRKPIVLQYSHDWTMAKALITPQQEVAHG